LSAEGRSDRQVRLPRRVGRALGKTMIWDRTESAGDRLPRAQDSRCPCRQDQLGDKALVREAVLRSTASYRPSSDTAPDTGKHRGWQAGREDNRNQLRALTDTAQDKMTLLHHTVLVREAAS
jgi:hypothetical protein